MSDIRQEIKDIYDITEMASLKSFYGISLDLVAVALTSDLIAVLSARYHTISLPQLSVGISLHLITFLIIISLLATTEKSEIQDSKGKPCEKVEPVSKKLSCYVHRDDFGVLLAITLALTMVVTSLMITWNAI